MKWIWNIECVNTCNEPTNNKKILFELNHIPITYLIALFPMQISVRLTANSRSLLHISHFFSHAHVSVSLVFFMLSSFFLVIRSLPHALLFTRKSKLSVKNFFRFLVRITTACVSCGMSIWLVYFISMCITMSIFKMFFGVHLFGLNGTCNIVVVFLFNLTRFESV